MSQEDAEVYLASLEIDDYVPVEIASDAPIRETLSVLAPITLGVLASQIPAFVVYSQAES